MAKQRTYKQGLFTPRHPEKYIGDATHIVYRSSWELEFNKYLDGNPNIMRWNSEEIAIPYIKPTDNRVHRYFPDYWIEYRNKSGQIVQEIVEVKPSSQVAPPTGRGSRQTRLYEATTHAVNQAKWSAAAEWCKQRGLLFRILTEKELFGRVQQPRRKSNGRKVRSSRANNRPSNGRRSGN